VNRIRQRRMTIRVPANDLLRPGNPHVSDRRTRPPRSSTRSCRARTCPRHRSCPRPETGRAFEGSRAASARCTNRRAGSTPGRERDKLRAGRRTRCPRLGGTRRLGDIGRRARTCNHRRAGSTPDRSPRCAGRGSDCTRPGIARCTGCRRRAGCTPAGTATRRGSAGRRCHCTRRDSPIRTGPGYSRGCNRSRRIVDHRAGCPGRAPYTRRGNPARRDHRRTGDCTPAANRTAGCTHSAGKRWCCIRQGIRRYTDRRHKAGCTRAGIAWRTGSGDRRRHYTRPGTRSRTARDCNRRCTGCLRIAFGTGRCRDCRRDCRTCSDTQPRRCRRRRSSRSLPGGCRNSN